MADLLKLALVLAGIVVLLRRRVPVGPAMVSGALLLGLLYLTPPARVLGAAWDAVTYRVTIELLTALSLIRMLEMLLRERDVLGTMMRAFSRLAGNRKATIISMPMLIGMLPSVGGAYFSAPMVDEAARETAMPAEEKAFVNYWFRHPWEYVLPLYPGLLLAAGLTGQSVRSMMVHNIPVALVMFLAGLAYSMRGIGPGSARREPVTREELMSFVPIGAVLVLVIALHVKLYVALGAVVLALCAFWRLHPRDLWRVVRYGVSLQVVGLIFGVMFLKTMMQATGSVESLSADFTAWGVPLVPTLIALPMITGLLTGLTIGFVGATFPLLVSLPGGAEPGAIALAFCAGFVGVLLSPVHVCLVLTREYFHAPMGPLYRRMLVPSALLVATALGVYLLS
jgi:hypothetical protein